MPSTPHPSMYQSDWWAKHYSLKYYLTCLYLRRWKRYLLMLCLRSRSKLPVESKSYADINRFLGWNWQSSTLKFAYVVAGAPHTQARSNEQWTDQKHKVAAHCNLARALTSTNTFSRRRTSLWGGIPVCTAGSSCRQLNIYRRLYCCRRVKSCCRILLSSDHPHE